MLLSYCRTVGRFRKWAYNLFLLSFFKKRNILFITSSLYLSLSWFFFSLSPDSCLPQERHWKSSRFLVTSQNLPPLPPPPVASGTWRRPWATSYIVGPCPLLLPPLQFLFLTTPLKAPPPTVAPTRPFPPPLIASLVNHRTGRPVAQAVSPSLALLDRDQAEIGLHGNPEEKL